MKTAHLAIVVFGRFTNKYSTASIACGNGSETTNGKIS